MEKNVTRLTSARAVTRAIAECDKVGRETFLAKYGYERARKYSLVFSGKEYDSKAIAGVAFGNQFGTPLKANEFSGGLERTVPTLEKLGFHIQRPVEIKDASSDAAMRFFWVNLGGTNAEVTTHGFLWAPQVNEKPKDRENLTTGTIVRHYAHWSNVGTVKAGDIIFANVDRRILFVAVALTDAVNAPRPPTRAPDQWNNLGFKVPVKMFPLLSPLSIHGDIKQAFDRRYNELSKPKVFKGNGDVFQGYMAAIPDGAGVEILQLLGSIEQDSVEASDQLRSQGARPKTTHRKPVGPTTKQAIRDARVGQGYFRQELLKMWKCCPVTGVKNPDLLIASHLKPWSRSNDDERLDKFNGFLLAPHIDRSFDKGLISFNDSGRIIISSLLKRADKEALGIHTGITISIDLKHRKYLAAHRQLFGL